MISRRWCLPLFCCPGLITILLTAWGLLNAGTTDSLLATVSRFKGIPPGPDWDAKLRMALTDGLLLGGLTLITGALLARRDWLKTLQEQRILRLSAACVVVVLVQGMVAFLSKSFVLHGERIWFLDDDAMISMRYGHHLAAGHGLVWNIGERIEGYTNFLWTVFMGAVHLLPVAEARMSLVILLTNLLFTCLLLTQVDTLAKKLCLTGGLPLLVLFLCATSRDLLLWSASGLETMALTTAFTSALALLLDGQERRGREVLAFLLIGLLPLIRADAVVLSGLLIGLAFLRQPHRMRSLVVLGTGAMIPGLTHLAFRWFYYGEMIPNTAYLKVASWDGRTLWGLHYGRSFAETYWALLLLAAFALIRLRDRTAAGLALLLGGYACYVIYIGGDAFAGYRFFVPVLPLMIVLAGAGIERLRGGLASRTVTVIFVVLFTPLFFPNRFVPFAPGLASSLSPSYVDTGNIEIGLWLRENTPSDASVGDFWAGSVFYFSHRRGIDFLGKMDSLIARLPAVCDSGRPGHNKWNLDVSVGLRKPDYVLGGFKLTPEGGAIDPVGKLLAWDRESADPCNFFNSLLISEEFHRRCLGHVAENKSWRTVFRCEH